MPERFYRWQWLPGGCHPRARTPERSRPHPRPPAQPQVSPCSLCQSLTGPPEQCFPPNLPCLLGRPLGRPPELFNPPAKSSVHPPDILWFLSALPSGQPPDIPWSLYALPSSHPPEVPSFLSVPDHPLFFPCFLWTVFPFFLCPWTTSLVCS